jgi:hypothetical protein
MIENKPDVHRARDNTRPWNEEREKEYQKGYRESHLEETREYNRSYQEKNFEELKEKKKVYRSNNSDSIKYRARSWRLKCRYGITVEEYNGMVDEQSGLCAICSICPSSPLVIDHCHSTGEVRGLLCILCNQAIGMLKDDPEILQSAIEYLKKVRRKR